MSEEYTGKDVSYYLVKIDKPKRLDPYTAECEDIIEALGMSFAEGCAFKAIWRKCAARTLGLSKAGYKGGLYDAEKTQYYGARMVAAEQPVNCSHCGVSEGSLHRPDCHLMRRGKSQAADIYAHFAARTDVRGFTAGLKAGKAAWDDAQAATAHVPEHDPNQRLALSTPRRGVNDAACRECGCPTDAVGTHYATCSQLTAPEEYKAEAQVAFEEAARPHMLTDYEEWICRDCGTVHTRIGNLQQRVGLKPCKPWCPEPGSAEPAQAPEVPAIGHTIRPPKEVLVEVSDAWRRANTAEPATPIVHNDMDEARVDIVASSHGDGEHYDDPWAGAPEWAKWKAQDADGEWCWFENKPVKSSSKRMWLPRLGMTGRISPKGDPNPRWRHTLIWRRENAETPNNKNQE